jgi:hypothetical protein
MNVNEIFTNKKGGAVSIQRTAWPCVLKRVATVGSLAINRFKIRASRKRRLC